MRSLYYAATCLFIGLAPLSAQEVSFRPLETAPQGFTSFKLTVKAPTLTNSVWVEIDVYRDGKKAETLFGPGVVKGTGKRNPQPLDVQAVLQFEPRKGEPTKGQLSLKWHNTRSTKRLDLTGGEFPFEHVVAVGTFSSPSFTENRTPVFYLILSPDGSRPNRLYTKTPDAIVKASADKILLIGYVTRDFLTVD